MDTPTDHLAPGYCWAGQPLDWRTTADGSLRADVLDPDTVAPVHAHATIWPPRFDGKRVVVVGFYTPHAVDTTIGSRGRGGHSSIVRADEDGLKAVAVALLELGPTTE